MKKRFMNILGYAGIISTVLLCLKTDVSAYAAKLPDCVFKHFVNTVEFNLYMSEIEEKNFTNVTTTLSSIREYLDYVEDAGDASFIAPNDMAGSEYSCSYILQGICYNTYKDSTYVMVSAYNGTNEDATSVVFISKDKENYTKIYLEGYDAHFGGIASVGEYVYITGSRGNILRIKDADIFNCYESAKATENTGNVVAEATLSKDKISKITIDYAAISSYVTYDRDNNLLWVGNFSMTDDYAYMYAYEIGKLNTAKVGKKVTYKYKMQIPTYIQGAAFRMIDGEYYLALSRSYAGRLHSSFTSEVYLYTGITFNDKEKTAVLSDGTEPVKKFMVPPMAEGIYIGQTYMYIVFESNAEPYMKGMLRCKSILAIKNSDLIKE